ncbi:MAG: NAD(P)H-dependent oxidoreductase [Candidatus Pacebacteria bacterium]|nr:NAD(P)H-dependent oxidoreductase [Candidatus Paceibacterota bacterium]
MKIIALSCSPSKGRNSDSMLDYFIKGASQINGINIEKIYLDDLEIDYYCYENRNGAEEHEKEFARISNILQKEAVGVIISSPTYNFSVPAKLKNFIDRIGFFALDFSKKTKLNQPIGTLKHLNFYFIVSGGTPIWVQKIIFFILPLFWLKIVFKYFGANNLGSFYSGDIKAFKNKKILDKCYKKGIKYAKQLSKKQEKKISRMFFW